MATNIRKTREKWALITGGAGGIGAELGRLFARDGWNLVLVDRNADGLTAICLDFEKRFKIQTLALEYDLSRPESPSQIHDELQEKRIEIEILVNNAGFGTFGLFWETETAREQALINVNIMTPMLLTKLFLPAMVKRKRGRILNVGSISGFLASPHASTYYASKAWLLSFSQGIATSLAGTGVSVTLICPGPTYTAFDWHNPDGNGPPPQRKKFQMEASEVAALAYRGLMRRQMMVIPGASNRFLALLAKLLPRKFALWLTTMGQNQAN